MDKRKEECQLDPDIDQSSGSENESGDKYYIECHCDELDTDPSEMHPERIQSETNDKGQSVIPCPYELCGEMVPLEIFNQHMEICRFRAETDLDTEIVSDPDVSETDNYEICYNCWDVIYKEVFEAHQVTCLYTKRVSENTF